MNSKIVTFDDLKKILNYEDQRQIIACLTENKIPFRRGKRGRPWTTVDAINAAMGVTQIQQRDENGIFF
ncbi:MAG: hypothetical protein KZQ95_01960 [Candidatus Thiodiazotropha sp. (ex Epidulcina cf. delphinae)]|nr:hypothetical protein [Candidatus Thiodiazotropha sp. (ex Epidulcina cf. delphinae)]